MTRDHHQTHRSSKSSSSAAASATASANQSSGQHHNTHHHNHHKIVQFEPFYLQSEDDKSLKQAAELVETASLSRFKVCIVSIISKEPLGESMKNHLAQSILSNGPDKTRGRNRGKHHHQAKISGNNNNSSKIENIKTTTSNNYENQVVGHVDSKAGVIVLNLTSFNEANTLHLLSETANCLIDNNNCQDETQSFLSSVWPTWNQNLLKTLLTLFTLSHIVVFYNPEPSMDYNLIQTFKILETLRLKSQARITDLLETIASKQMFPQNWIRLGRVACPRALFVCDASNLDININQGDMANVKRDLEDQIYKLLKKTNILARPSSSIQAAGSQTTVGLLSLPERDDFVFIITRHHGAAQTSRNKETSTTNEFIEEQSQRELFYSNLFRSLGLCRDGDNDNDKVEKSQLLAEPNEKSQPVSDDDLSQDDTTITTELASLQVEPIEAPKPAKSNLTAHQNRFRKFLNRHISDIQAASQTIDQTDNHKNNNHSGKATNLLLLPRYDDFFTVLLRLKSLLFPPLAASSHLLCDQSQQQQQTSTGTPNITNNRIAPDERRFVDIYDLVNNDELFSKRHCCKTRLAAFDYYCRDLRVQACGPTLTHAHHENILESAKKLYLNHARGSSCGQNLDLLIDQCNLYWQNLGHSKVLKQSAEENKADGRVFKSNRLCKTISSDIVPSTQQSSTQMHNSKASLSIVRRSNGIKVTTSCDCGRQSNLMITPVDRKKKLERVDIHRINE